MKIWLKLHFLPKKIMPAVLFIVIVFFGLVGIIYEENSKYEDKLARLIPAEDIALYLHADKKNETTALWQSLPKELTDLWLEKNPEFFAEWESVRNLAITEYAFALIRNGNSISPVWLLYCPVKNSVQFTTNQDFSRFGDVIILGKDSKIVAGMIIGSENKTLSLFDYFQDNDSQSAQAAYAYIDFDILPNQENNFFIQGKWQLQIKPTQIEILSLESISDNQFVIYDTDWLQIFYNEYFVWQKLNPSDLQTIVAQNWLLSSIREQFTKFRTMTRFDTNSFIDNLTSPSDLVVSNTPEGSVYWLVRTGWSEDLLNELNRNIKQLIGYENPTLATSTLPDGTLAREYKAIPREFAYQNLQQIDQEVQIVYINDQDYFIWIKQGDYLLFGNSLKLMNRYLSKSRPDNVKKQNCLIPGGKGILIGSNQANKLKNPIVIREIWSKNTLKYYMCY